MTSPFNIIRSKVLDRDFLFRRYTPVAMIVSFITCILSIVLGMEYYSAAGFLVLPFVIVGVAYLVLDRHWAVLILSLAISLLILPFSVKCAFIVVCMTFGCEGIAVLASAAQRCIFFSPFDHMGPREVSGNTSVVIRSLFGVPYGIDTRDIHFDASVIRHEIPWKDMIGTAVLALPLSMLLWIVVLMVPQIGGDGVHHLAALLSVMSYVIFLAIIPIIYRSLNVRICDSSQNIDLYRGLIGTAVKMSLVLLVMLIVTIAVSDYTSGELLNIVSCLIVSAVMTVFASTSFYVRHESKVVSEISDERRKHRSVSLYCELEHSAPPTLDDGVPGTPMRRDR